VKKNVIDVVDDHEAEECAMMVCAKKGMPTPFTDNLEGECETCGQAIIFRPDAPKRPRKVCMDCVMEHGFDELGAMLGVEEEEDGRKFVLTKRQLGELAKLGRKQ
jgi:hypothetical protein